MVVFLLFLSYCFFIPLIIVLFENPHWRKKCLESELTFYTLCLFFLILFVFLFLLHFFDEWFYFAQSNTVFNQMKNSKPLHFFQTFTVFLRNSLLFHSNKFNFNSLYYTRNLCIFVALKFIFTPKYIEILNINSSEFSNCKLFSILQRIVHFFIRTQWQLNWYWNWKR